MVAEYFTLWFKLLFTAGIHICNKHFTLHRPHTVQYVLLCQFFVIEMKTPYNGSPVSIAGFPTYLFCSGFDGLDEIHACWKLKMHLQQGWSFLRYSGWFLYLHLWCGIVMCTSFFIWQCQHLLTYLSVISPVLYIWKDQTLKPNPGIGKHICLHLFEEYRFLAQWKIFLHAKCLYWLANQYSPRQCFRVQPSLVHQTNSCHSANGSDNNGTFTSALWLFWNQSTTNDNSYKPQNGGVSSIGVGCGWNEVKALSIAVTPLLSKLQWRAHCYW